MFVGLGMLGCVGRGVIVAVGFGILVIIIGGGFEGGTIVDLGELITIVAGSVTAKVGCIHDIVAISTPVSLQPFNKNNIKGKRIIRLICHTHFSLLMIRVTVKITLQSTSIWRFISYWHTITREVNIELKNGMRFSMTQAFSCGFSEVAQRSLKA
ncbi:MAG: hypothetical protein IAF02_12370 [Anaerolineae bacterium]|nr:hypothetical protein [Anaerolineae bacterium]